MTRTYKIITIITITNNNNNNSSIVLIIGIVSRSWGKNRQDIVLGKFAALTDPSPKANKIIMLVMTFWRWKRRK